MQSNIADTAVVHVRSVSPITDPTAMRIEASNETLPAVGLEALSAEALRARFAQPPAWSPEVIDDRVRFNDREPKPAAVLVPLVLRANALTVLLTERTAHLSSHAGQIAFPGGRSEPHDDGPTGTALREAYEEIGLGARHVEVIGTMPVYRTGSGYLVTPVVGLVDPGHVVSVDPFEVAEAFEVPLGFLMDPANHERRVFRAADVERSFYAMPYRPSHDHPREYFIWGATAAMLRNLYRFLSA